MEKIIVAYTCVTAAFVLTFTAGAGLGAKFSSGAQPEGPGVVGAQTNDPTDEISAQNPTVPESDPSPAPEASVVTGEGFILRLSESGDAYYLEGFSNMPEYRGYDKDVVIPSSYNGLPVTKILPQAFGLLFDITSVEIPDSITEIGELAFSNCRYLTNVTIPDSVTQIDRFAFANCRSLTSITIPDRVTKIGNYVFSGCDSLTSVTLPKGMTEIPDGLFLASNNLTDVTIPDTVTKIGGSAFACEKLTSITIPASVTEIRSGAFNWENLTDVYFEGTKEQWEALHIESLLWYHPCTIHIDGEEFHFGVSE